MANLYTTPFSDIYDSFLAKVTDDMYMELSQDDTYKMLEELLLSAIPKFEFPRKDISDYKKSYTTTATVDEQTKTVYKVGYFNSKLTAEEINILATYMVVEWLGQQLASIENVRMKYSGTDFKFTSQANHMAKLKTLIDAAKQDGFHLQRLYKRRKLSNGKIHSAFGQIMEVPQYGYKI